MTPADRETSARPNTVLNDPEYVQAQYASEAGLAARQAVYVDTITGPDAREVVLAAILDPEPRAVLEVGCGQGELAERIAATGVHVVATDQSPRMVELTLARGLDARVADAQELPFDGGSFDVVVAAWMLYHVPDIGRAIAEFARVLRPGGRLVAVTNASDHLAEMRALVGLGRWELPFAAENADALLRESFGHVERHDAFGTVTFPEIDAIRAYYDSSERLRPYLARLPERLDAPLVARRCPVVFVATEPG